MLNVAASLVGSAVTANTASVGGGGIYLATGPASLALDAACVIGGNQVLSGQGAQLRSDASGAVLWGANLTHLSLGQSQLVVQNGGNLTMSAFVCPAGSLFRDSSAGLYGASAIVVATGYAKDIFLDGQYLTTQLDYGCVVCPSETYALTGGFTSGAPSQQDNPTCLPCPYGAQCGTGSSIAAAPGYWGTIVDGAAVMAVCPVGYCCDQAGTGGADNGTSGASGHTLCAGLAACAGNREGRLCGRCKPGYGEAMGSSICRADAQCNDGAWFWPVFTLGMLLCGAVMLYNSELWCPRVSRLKGIPKFISYYYQVRMGSVAAHAKMCI